MGAKAGSDRKPQPRQLDCEADTRQKSSREKAQMMPEWTEGICGDGAVILRDGVMVPIVDVLAALNAAENARSAALEEAAKLFKEIRLITRQDQAVRNLIPLAQAEILAEMDRQQFAAAIRERAKTT